MENSTQNQTTENEEKLRDVTLVFLIKKSDNHISEVCLAMKKRGFGMNRWNGTGGKLEVGETIVDATKREAREEIGVEINQLNKVAELSFYFPHNPAWHQKVYVFFSDSWVGEPSESEEMKPKWFYVSDVPYDDMWPDDKFWLPEVISGKLIKAKFVFGEGDVISEQDMQIVESL